MQQDDPGDFHVSVIIAMPSRLPRRCRSLTGAREAGRTENTSGFGDSGTSEVTESDFDFTVGVAHTRYVQQKV